MLITYDFSDGRGKEDDDARLGFPHKIMVHGTSIQHGSSMILWCAANLNSNWKHTWISSTSPEDPEPIFCYIFHFSDAEEAFLFRLRWS
jgi:hypothetical protein